MTLCLSLPVGKLLKLRALGEEGVEVMVTDGHLGFWTLDV